MTNGEWIRCFCLDTIYYIFSGNLNLWPHERGAITLLLCYSAVIVSNREIAPANIETSLEKATTDDEAPVHLIKFEIPDSTTTTTEKRVDPRCERGRERRTQRRTETGTSVERSEEDRLHADLRHTRFIRYSPPFSVGARWRRALGVVSPRRDGRRDPPVTTCLARPYLSPDEQSHGDNRESELQFYSQELLQSGNQDISNQTVTKVVLNEQFFLKNSNFPTYPNENC